MLFFISLMCQEGVPAFSRKHFEETWVFFSPTIYLQTTSDSIYPSNVTYQAYTTKLHNTYTQTHTQKLRMFLDHRDVPQIQNKSQSQTV